MFTLNRTRRFFGLMAVSIALSGAVSDSRAASTKKTGLTLGGNGAFLMGGGLIYGANLGVRTRPVDFIADAYWASASGVSVALYRLNILFGIGNFFIGPHAGMSTITISIAGFTPLSVSGLTVGGTLGYNIWLGKSFALSPVLHTAILPSLLNDAGAQLSVTF